MWAALQLSVFAIGFRCPDISNPARSGATDVAFFLCRCCPLMWTRLLPRQTIGIGPLCVAGDPHSPCVLQLTSDSADFVVRSLWGPHKWPEHRVKPGVTGVYGSPVSSLYLHNSVNRSQEGEELVVSEDRRAIAVAVGSCSDFEVGRT